MKKRIIIILTAVIIFGMTACGTKKEQVSLYDQGLEVVALMDEMADSQSYVQMFTGNAQISEVIQSNTNGDYSKPQAVYEVVLQKDNLFGEELTNHTEESISQLFEGLYETVQKVER